MKRVQLLLFSAVLTLGLAGWAQQSGNSTQLDKRQDTYSTNPREASREQSRISREVRHELLMLPYYSVFDDLKYSVQGNTVVLLGDVVNAVTKDDAEHSVKKIEGVDKVVNKINILPASPNDDRIRREMLRAIFGTPGLDRYGFQAVPSIHIVVENGHVKLTGVVDSESDKNMAGIKANGVPGVFSVENDLQVAGTSKKVASR
jgi:hyperosmotically inducible protein